jgi:hypothetical protein|tara:strand:+ start:2702 stop:3052 length:351 start_codon:yes stop_codon:yes gene_type:complete
MNNITQKLEEEITLNKKESWTKLDKTLKLKKIMDYVVLYSKKHNFSDDKQKELQGFLKVKLNKRRLLTTNDITYDINKMTITDIPGLDKTSDGNFLLRRNEKRSSTVKSLTPTKKN